MDGGKLQNLSEIACKSCFILKEIAFITTMKKIVEIFIKKIELYYYSFSIFSTLNKFTTVI